jgi:hypothetical protein
LNAHTSYVVPLGIEDQLGFDPNSWEMDPDENENRILISSDAELAVALENLATIAAHAEAISEAIDEYIADKPISRDGVFSMCWEKIVLLPAEIVGASIEMLRRIRS